MTEATDQERGWKQFQPRFFWNAWFSEARLAFHLLLSSLLAMLKMRTINKTKLRSAVLALFLAATIIQFGRSAVGTFCVVDGESMSPTLNPEDVVQAKTSFVKARGDVVVISDDGGDLAIKRIVGLPGETVTIYKGYVYVNGRRLLEQYLAKGSYTFKHNARDERAAVWNLGADQYFVLGDNREESRDSRHYGPLQRSDVHGVINLPANAPEPALLEILLSESGKVTHRKQYRTGWNRIRTRSNPALADNNI